jgi:hypothetical protein
MNTIKLDISKTLDLIMPYTYDELRCGNQKMRKVKRRGRFIELLNDYMDGKEVKWDSVLYKDELPKFLELLNSKS